MDDRWIPVLVRIEDYEEVAAWVAAREDSRDGKAAALGSTSVTGTGRAGGETPAGAPQVLNEYPAWPTEALQRLANSSFLTAKRWTRAVDVCASAEKTWLTTSEIAERAGMSINEWRDAPRKLPRHLKKHYSTLPASPDGGLAWPLVAWGVPGSGEVSWAIPPTTKERWLEVRGEKKQ